MSSHQYTHLCVIQRVQTRSRRGTLKLQGPGDIKRREVVLDPVVSPEEIMSREVELGCGSWTSVLLHVFTQQRCNGHCPCYSALAQQVKQHLLSTLVAAQWPGDTALTLPLFWRRSTASSVFRVGARARAITLSSPPPLPPVPNKQPRFCGRQAKC